MLKLYYQTWCLLSVAFLVPRAICDTDKVVFQFPEYDYKETSKNELAFREYESACDQSTRCSIFEGIEKTRCVRECVSPSCYKEIYKFDEVKFAESIDGGPIGRRFLCRHIELGPTKVSCKTKFCDLLFNAQNREINVYLWWKQYLPDPSSSELLYWP